MAEAKMSKLAVSDAIPPGTIGGEAFLMAERQVLGALVRNPREVRCQKRQGLKAGCFVHPLHRRIFQKLVLLVRRNGNSSRVSPQRFMKNDAVLKTLGTPQTLMELSNEAASDETVGELTRLLVSQCDIRRRTVWNTRAALERGNELERPLQIKRLAKLDAHSLTEVIAASLGSSALGDRMDRHAQPLV